MGVFIDTGVFVATRNIRDVNHSRAIELLREAVNGKWGTMYTSNFIFDEAVTLALVRTKRVDIALDIGNFILSAPIVFLHVNEEAFNIAWTIFKRYAERGLSFTDSTSIALMRIHRIEYIMSFDKHFDGIVSRLY